MGWDGVQRGRGMARRGHRVTENYICCCDKGLDNRDFNRFDSFISHPQF